MDPQYAAKHRSAAGEVSLGEVGNGTGLSVSFTFVHRRTWFATEEDPEHMLAHTEEERGMAQAYHS
jgi:hypothetical protein